MKHFNYVHAICCLVVVLCLSSSNGMAQRENKYKIDPGINLIHPLADTHPLDFSELYDIIPDVQNCYEGELKQSEKLKVLNKLNYVRSLHRLRPVLYKFQSDIETAKACLIMVANHTLTHYPDSSLICWSNEGDKGASTSNLWLGPAGYASEDQIDDYLADYGVISVGHRSWLIDPFLKYISFGRVDAADISAGAIQVIHNEQQILNDQDVDFVAFPFEEYPAEFFEKIWYLSFSVIANNNGQRTDWGVDFSIATVEVTEENGTSMPIHDIRSDYGGYGLLNLLQWKVDLIRDNNKYYIKINNVKVLEKYQNYEYWFVSKVFIPELQAPPNYDYNVCMTPTFQWSSVDSQAVYHLQIAKDISFQEKILNNDRMIANSFSLADSILSEDTWYYWRVRAINFEGIAHVWSQVWKFKTVQSPNSQLSLIAPQNGQQQVDPFVYFQWSALTAFNVETFEFQASTDSTLLKNVIAVKVPGTWSGFMFSQYSPLEYGKKYFWHIRAILSGGNQNITSDLWNFTVRALTPIDENTLCSPKTYSLSQNYPNPFNSTTIIEFDLPKMEHAALDIFALNGQHVKSLTNELMPPGHHQLTFDANELPSGVYIYRLKTAHIKLSRKLIIIK